MTYETERMIWLVVFFDFATFLTKSAKLFGKMPRAEARLSQVIISLWLLPGALGPFKRT